MTESIMKKIFSGFIAKAQKNGPYTAFDLMKLFAIFNMTVDHLGLYFFPDDMWWRAVGRITFPVWFFLVGYSRSRSLGSNIWIYAGLLLANHLFVGRAVFPVNALVSVILCRSMLNICQDYNLLPAKLPEIMTFFVIISLITIPFFEYGSIAFMFAIFGHMVRENQKQNFTLVAVVAYTTFVLWQVILFQFNIVQSFYVILGTAWVVKWLARPGHAIICPNWQDSGWQTFIAVLSRNTLFYYFIHRMIFEIAANLLYGKAVGFLVKFF